MAKFWSANVIDAIAHMHGQGVAYRDMKPENLLVDEQGYVILIDLGFAKKIPYSEVVNGQSVQHDLSYTLCGTFEYLAPEFFFDGHGHNHAVDYWSFGCLLYELIMGQTPFVDFPGEDNVRKLIKRICMTQFQPFEFPREFDRCAATHSMKSSDACRHLVSRLLRPNPAERLGNLAAGPDGIKQHAYFAEIDFEKMVRRELQAPWTPPAVCYDRTVRPLESNHLVTNPFAGSQKPFAGW